MKLYGRRLDLVLQTLGEVEGMIEAMSESDRAQISPGWLERFRASPIPHPWVYPFRIVLRDSGFVVGTCSFKGPPIGGVVEIAYAIHSGHEGRGYATEAAQLMIDYASASGEVRLITAHTLPHGVASKRVLEKCGFRLAGETVDPEDGTVTRFERDAGFDANRT